MEKVYTVLVIIGYILNFLFISFTLFFERKTPARRVAWLLLLSFLPLVGAILYIIFSGHFFTKTRRMETSQKMVAKILEPYIARQKNFFLEYKKDLFNFDIKRFMPIINMNLATANSLVTFSESIAVFCWGQDMFDILYKDIENAKKSIHLEYFIFHNDTTGTRILDLLCKKAKEGVSVKLLFDDMGSFLTPRYFFKPLINAGGEVLPFFNLKRGAFFSINFRNHRKITVIDGEIAYVGGLNIGDEYANCSKTRKWKNTLWRDTHLRLTGSSVFPLQTIFLTDWFSICEGKNLPKNPEDAKLFFPVEDFTRMSEQITNESTEDYIATSVMKNLVPTQIVSSGPDNQQKAEIRDMLIRMIISARKTVRIETPYFTPDETFLSILKIAAQSGIKVEIIVPGTWDKWYVREAALDFIRESLNYGIRFFAYKGFIHSKMCIVDGNVVTIGTTNIDSRSFDLHFEVNTIFYDKIFTRECEEIFLEDKLNSKEVFISDIKHHFILRRALWGFWRLFSPLM